LEKIEMKKTLVAVAAMAAVTGAMADGATIYGVLDQAYYTNKATTPAGVVSKTTGVGAVIWGGSGFGLKGSEDLGGGTKANYALEVGYAADTGGGAVANRVSTGGLSGDFGAVNLGNQYTPGWGILCGTDFNGCGSNPGWAGGNGLMTVSSGSSIYYSSPAMSGLTAHVVRGFGEATTSPTAVVKTNDYTEFALTYASGPLTAGYSTQSTVASTPASNTFGSLANTSFAVNPSVAGAKEKVNIIGVNYDLGIAKVGFSNVSYTLSATSAKLQTISGQIPVTAMVNLNVSSTTGRHIDSAGAAGVNFKASQYGLDYNFTKRTALQWRMGSSSDNQVAGSQKASQTSFGMFHSF